MPATVRDSFGYALYLAQLGGKHPNSKPLKGFGHAGVLEVVEDFHGDTFRAVYTLRVGDAVYVLHCFQKKSTRNIQTPQHDIALIKTRLASAQSHWKGLHND
ncbi:type II toxin-antitoxin system RelE/ParE family toxin [Pseudomonas sp. F3-2]|uniref:type II toxin-antitoxin system RelE/ParE family toxin n=1 Tax=Pseudomonas sp. F3-2 TaxID=3141539 RepID=UPI00315D6C64